MRLGTLTYGYDLVVRRISMGGIISLLGIGPPVHHNRPNLSGEIDEVFQRTHSSGVANFLTDALGSTLALTDSSGSTIASYAYEPFGNTTVTSGSSANPYQYTGRENDGTGVYFYRGRYYNPAFQRFISEDPIGMAGSGPNLYAYVGNNPISFRDPFGTDKRGAGWASAVGHYLWNNLTNGCGTSLQNICASSVPLNPFGGLAAGAAEAAAEDAAEGAASSPVGSQRSPMTNFDPNGPPINDPGTINGTNYSGHALDQMANRGIPPSVVDNTLATGQTSVGNAAGTAVTYDPVNNISVVTNSSGTVVTVRYGAP